MTPDELDEIMARVREQATAEATREDGTVDQEVFFRALRRLATEEAGK